MSSLIVLEHDGGRLRPPALAAIRFGSLLQELGLGPVYHLLLGSDADPAAQQARHYGAERLVLATSVGDHRVADRDSHAIREVARRFEAGIVTAGSSTYSREVLPRVAAQFGAAMVSDVVSVRREGAGVIVRRPVYAGNALADVAVDQLPLVATCRTTAFSALEASPTPLVDVERIETSTTESRIRFLSQEHRPAGRPELTEARRVVSGGRPLGDSETFERLIGGLADTLDAAVGATRAAVDSGIAPNDWQVGQTGKVIAPDLYLCCGVSGAIQHLAGMKDSRTIVAINKDPDAPIFQVATYGLVADLFKAVPELTAALRADRAAR